MENNEEINQEFVSLLEADEELQRDFMEQIANSSRVIDKSEEKLAFSLLRM